MITLQALYHPFSLRTTANTSTARGIYKHAHTEHPKLLGYRRAAEDVKTRYPAPKNGPPRERSKDSPRVIPPTLPVRELTRRLRLYYPPALTDRSDRSSCMGTAPSQKRRAEAILKISLIEELSPTPGEPCWRPRRSSTYPMVPVDKYRVPSTVPQT